MNAIRLNVVCCEASDEKYSTVVELEIDSSVVDQTLLESAEQELPAGESRGLHNAAPHPAHGVVTYLQQVNSGSFSVFYGNPDDLRELVLSAGDWVAFMDDQGPGHASQVGPNGVQRTFRILKGHLTLPS